MADIKTFGNAMPFEFNPKPLESTCEKHGVNLYKFAGREICPECAKELTESSSLSLAEKETEKAYYRDQTWLTNKSIFSDESLKNASFNSYETGDEETKRNKEMARQVAGDYLKGANYNTIFSGAVGTGKSHLAMSMCKAINEHSKPFRKCLLVSIDELMRRIKGSFNRKDSLYTEERMVDMLTEADLLVLDDLGAEIGAMDSERSASDFNVRVLNSIVNGRMNKPTIITTNLSAEQMNRMYDDRIISRIARGAEKGKSIITFKETTDKRQKLEF